MNVKFESAVTRAIARDPRFVADAYYFLRDALDATIKGLPHSGDKSSMHVNPQTLCMGFRDFAKSLYGPMVPAIMESWGVTSTADIGQIVFNLIESGAFSKGDTDRQEDFAGVFTFEEAFVQPYRSVSAAG